MLAGLEIIACCLYLIAGVQAEKVVSEEIKDDENLRRDRNTYSVDQARRSIVDDAKWHVAHLHEHDDMNFGLRRSDCKEETSEEKALRYRKALLNDAALVQYVSADALEVDDKDKAGNVCYMPEAVERIFKFHNKSDKANEKKVEELVSNKGGEVEAKNVEANVETATVHAGKEVPKDLRRKPSEYMFSSIEYYDTVPTFDTMSVCPETLAEVILETEFIGEYDIECEILTLWYSLD